MKIESAAIVQTTRVVEAIEDYIQALRISSSRLAS